MAGDTQDLFNLKPEEEDPKKKAPLEEYPIRRQLSWEDLDLAGSDITDLGSADHNDLTNQQGGASTERYHLTAAQHTDLTDGNDSTSHYHATDRDRANHTGTQTIATLSDLNVFKTIAVSGQSDVVADSGTDTLTLAAGSNITITTDASTDTVTIASSTSSSDSFKTIAVSGQSDVVADSSTDTLTLAAGSNITITTNAGTDTITIAASGSGGISSGTSNPGSPSDNDLFYRTDLDLLIFYNGTRWLTVQQYVIELKPFSNTFATAMSVTTASRMLGLKPCLQATDFWMEKGYVNGAATTAVSVTNHWVLEFRALPVLTSNGTTIASININTDGWVLNENHQSEVTIDALLGTSIQAVDLNCTEVGTSTLFIYDAKIVGRLVIT